MRNRVNRLVETSNVIIQFFYPVAKGRAICFQVQSRVGQKNKQRPQASSSSRWLELCRFFLLFRPFLFILCPFLLILATAHTESSNVHLSIARRCPVHASAPPPFSDQFLYRDTSFMRANRSSDASSPWRDSDDASLY